MSSVYGNRLKLSIFGQSHGPAVGMSLDGIPAGLPVDLQKLQAFLDRRKPGGSLASARKESDRPEFLSGIVKGFTCGAPIAATIPNGDHRSQDYENLKDTPRPGHADYTAQVKYGGFQDAAGGGHFSGRLTAPLCVAGGLCLQWLEEKKIYVQTVPVSVGSFTNPVEFSPAIEAARSAGTSLGAVIECRVTGLPAGLGDPMFEGAENRISQMIFAIPGVKGLEFGSGFAGSHSFGHENNDAFAFENGKVITKTNHAGGILGGITTGMPLIFRVAVKPTPSIARPQETLDLSTMESTTLSVTGRHDPCIGLRAMPAIEAGAAIALMDMLLARKGELAWN